ncbi:hypothetical protein [Lentzea sp. NPDC092896]|uniref:hypothetical protein n=1 Tax=Lentzea sp. NPDC092896 TaxID=3364127 RepID=UPI00382090E8
MSRRETIDGVVYGGASVLALLGALPAAILTLTGHALWPFFLFVPCALISLMLVYALLRGHLRVRRPWTPWRRTGAVAVAGTLTTTLALGALLISYAILGMPLKDDDLRRTCADRTANPRSAAPSSGEQVTRAYIDSGSGFWRMPESDVRPVEKVEDLPAVQQVACLSLLGSGGRLGTCSYGIGPGTGVSSTTTHYRGRWELSVRETRTGRRIAVRSLEGTTDGACSSEKWVVKGQTSSEYYTPPSAADVQAALAQR